MNVLNKHPPTENAVIIMKIGIKILNERAIPVGTESGILSYLAVCPNTKVQWSKV